MGNVESQPGRVPEVGTKNKGISRKGEILIKYIKWDVKSKQKSGNIWTPTLTQAIKIMQMRQGQSPSIIKEG